jgi:hypothetical protein
MVSRFGTQLGRVAVGAYLVDGLQWREMIADTTQGMPDRPRRLDSCISTSLDMAIAVLTLGV